MWETDSEKGAKRDVAEIEIGDRDRDGNKDREL